MNRFSVSFGVAATALLTSAASAQWVPGAEIVGQTVQVETNGVLNSVSFDQGGTARITTPAGRVVPASWTASNGQLCLHLGSGRECVPYTKPFEAGQAVTTTSSCGATSRWLASATNRAPVAQPENLGERG